MSRGERGITIFEVLIAGVLLAVTLVSLGLAVMTGVRSTADLGDRNLVHNQALSYMERLQKMPFGTPDDLPAAPTSLDQLFNDTLEVPGITLNQLRSEEEGDGLKFELANFERKGIWEVRVNRDINGNGILDPEEEKEDLLRVEILFDYQPVLTTYRVRPAVAQ